MKRLIAALILLLVLVGCGSKDKEFDSFVEKYNENAYDYVSVNLLDAEEFEEIKKEKYGNWRTIQTRNNYKITTKHYDDDKIKGYHIDISENEPFEYLEGQGIETAFNIVNTLELDLETFKENILITIENDDVTYSDNGYEIAIIKFDNLIIDFEKEE